MSLPARFSRTTLALGVLFGLLYGCASGGTDGDEAADAAKPDAAAPDAGEPESREEARPRAPNTVTAEDIARQPNQPIEEIIAGRVAGVEIRQTPNGRELRIRGQSSIMGDKEPLYVIDGVPIEPGPGGALAGIVPYDIESITVLKDVSETAMYGVRGANGVIVVTTKSPPN
jgi:TonB-dependent SusC/RagA subfamily outer membrane receptor